MFCYLGIIQVLQAAAGIPALLIFVILYLFTRWKAVTLLSSIFQLTKTKQKNWKHYTRRLSNKMMQATEKENWIKNLKNKFKKHGMHSAVYSLSTSSRYICKFHRMKDDNSIINWIYCFSVLSAAVTGKPEDGYVFYVVRGVKRRNIIKFCGQSLKCSWSALVCVCVYVVALLLTPLSSPYLCLPEGGSCCQQNKF